MHFFQKGLVICMSSFTLRLFSSPGEAVSCPCFQSDTRMSYLSEATGHWPAAVQPEIRSQMTSLKPNTQTRTNCVWILSRLWEIVKVCSQALYSGNTSSACPLSREKAQLKCVYAHLCVLLCICFSWSTKDSKGWKAGPPDSLCFRPNSMMSREKPQVQATKNILHLVDEPQASFQRSCSPLEEETGMESTLPAQLGTHLDMPGGLAFKAKKQQAVPKHLGRNRFHTQWPKLNNCPHWSRCPQASGFSPPPEQVKGLFSFTHKHPHWVAQWQQMCSESCLKMS